VGTVRLSAEVVNIWRDVAVVMMVEFKRQRVHKW